MNEAPVAPAELRQSYSPVVWLNLLCLDAPLVAVSWQWLFARSFGAHLGWSLRALLFLTAWLIYLGDRFADTIRLPADAPRSERHRFCQDHMSAWWIAIVVIFVADCALAVRSLDLQMFLLGATLAAICTIYLFFNHLLGGRWRPIPMKEKAVGVLFAAGTTLAVVGELPGLTISFAFAVVLFAILCTLNCLCIASWERELDAAQGKTSLLTGWPSVALALKPIGFGIVVASLVLALAWWFALALWVCLAVSAALLVWLHGATNLSRDNRTALADLVLLTPIFALLVSWR
ncbi:MAG TPA: hypothetical protein VHW03_00975 [Chthoniobacterales bacterium]|nr:hypothetical protein [Chthoniobacterales bacterium]